MQRSILVSRPWRHHKRSWCHDLDIAISLFVVSLDVAATTLGATRFVCSTTFFGLPGMNALATLFGLRRSSILATYFGLARVSWIWSFLGLFYPLTCENLSIVRGNSGGLRDPDPYLLSQTCVPWDSQGMLQLRLLLLWGPFGFHELRLTLVVAENSVSSATFWVVVVVVAFGPVNSGEPSSGVSSYDCSRGLLASHEQKNIFSDSPSWAPSFHYLNTEVHERNIYKTPTLRTPLFLYTLLLFL